MTSLSLVERLEAIISSKIRLCPMVEDGEEVGFSVDPASERAAAEAIAEAVSTRLEEYEKALRLIERDGFDQSVKWCRAVARTALAASLLNEKEG